MNEKSKWVGLPVLSVCFFFFFQLVSSKTAFAHHGKDFMIVETAEIPERGEGFLISSFETSSTLQTFTPRFLYSWTDSFATEVHVHFTKERGGNLKAASFAPEARFKLDGLKPSFLSDAALSVEYEFANDGHETEAQENEPALSDALEKKFHEESLPQDTKDVSGDHFEMRLSFSKPVQGFNVAANLTYGKPQSAPADYGYALGIKKNSEASLNFGIEVDGGFNNGSPYRIIPALYIKAKERFNFNMGVSFSRSKEEKTESILSSFVIKF